MLVLRRKQGQSITLRCECGESKVTVAELNGHMVNLGVEAPPAVIVLRSELVERDTVTEGEQR